LDLAPHPPLSDASDKAAAAEENPEERRPSRNIGAKHRHHRQHRTTRGRKQRKKMGSKKQKQQKQKNGQPWSMRRNKQSKIARRAQPEHSRSGSNSNGRRE
jgi:hypothetical protein